MKQRRSRALAARGLLEPWGIGAVVLLLVLFGALKVPLLDLPAFQDETYVLKAGWDLLQRSFNPLTEGLEAWGRPPLTFEMVAAAFFVSGAEIWSVHVLGLFWALVTIFFTYRIGALLWRREVGFCAAAMLSASPLFFAQAGLFHPDLPAAAFATIAIYGLVASRWGVYVAAASLMSLSKETSIVLIPVMAAYGMTRASDRSLRSMARWSAVGLLPLGVFSLWVALHKLATGFWWAEAMVLEGNMRIVVDNLEAGMLRRFTIRWLQVLLSNHQFVVGLVSVLAVGKAGRRVMRQGLGTVRAARPEELFMVASLAVFLLFHSAFGFLQPRYLLPVLPLVFLLAARLLAYVFPRRLRYSLLFAVALLMLGWFRAPDRYASPDATLDYVDAVRVHKSASEYLSMYHRQDVVFTSGFQSGVNLTLPYLGYVSEPLRVLPIKGVPREIRSEDLAHFDIAYHSSHDQFARLVQEVVIERRLTEVARFESGRHFVVLYR